MIGKLRHRVVIQQATVTRGDRGAEILTWNTFATVYADVRTVAGQEQVLATQLEVATLLHTITIRYAAGIVPKMRVKWGNRYFSIEAVIERDNRMRVLDLSCREVVGDAGVA
jgi:SPP1 family predicted phage head-tail adaptor